MPPLPSFSILERIVGIETEIKCMMPCCYGRVSVSSNGSLALRLQGRDRNALPCPHGFSILERIVGIETDGCRALSRSPTFRFSILERIVGIETCVHYY